MSRHLLIRCDRAGCPEQVITGASDTTPTSLGVPAGWLTLREEGLADKHYCSAACIAQAYVMPSPNVVLVNPSSADELAAWSDPTTLNVEQPTVPPSPPSTRSRKKAH